MYVDMYTCTCLCTYLPVDSEVTFSDIVMAFKEDEEEEEEFFVGIVAAESS